MGNINSIYGKATWFVSRLWFAVIRLWDDFFVRIIFFLTSFLKIKKWIVRFSSSSQVLSAFVNPFHSGNYYCSLLPMASTSAQDFFYHKLFWFCLLDLGILSIVFPIFFAMEFFLEVTNFWSQTWRAMIHISKLLGVPGLQCLQHSVPRATSKGQGISSFLFFLGFFESHSVTQAIWQVEDISTVARNTVKYELEKRDCEGKGTNIL